MSDIASPTLNALPSNSRFLFLDGLRGIAVLLVMFTHFTEGTVRSISNVNTHYFQIGQAGVTLFFLISGYIIPKTLDVVPNLRVFWLHRIFRLYPLYWMSICIAIIFSLLGFLKLPISLSGNSVWINFTMLQGFFNITNMLGVFWSLKFELAFYIVMSIIACTNFLSRPFLLVSIYSVGVILIALIMRFFLNKFFAYGLFHLELMLIGWAMGEWHLKKMGNKKAIVIAVLGLLTAIVSAFAAFAGRVDTVGIGTLTLVPMMTAWIWSLMFFIFALLTSELIRWPVWLAKLGMISYSAYLLHTIVMEVTAPFIGGWGFFSVAIWYVISLSFSWISFRYFELPFIRFGKKITNRVIRKNCTNKIMVA